MFFSVLSTLKYSKLNLLQKIYNLFFAKSETKLNDSVAK